MFSLFNNAVLPAPPLAHKPTDLQKCFVTIAQQLGVNDASSINHVFTTLAKDMTNNLDIVEYGYKMNLILQPLSQKSWHSLLHSFSPVLIQMNNFSNLRVFIKKVRQKYFIYNPDTETIETLLEENIQHYSMDQAWQCFPLLNIQNANYLQMFSSIFTKFKRPLLLACTFALLCAFATFFVSVATANLVTHLHDFSFYAYSSMLAVVFLILLSNFMLHYISHIHGHHLMLKMMIQIMPTLWHHLLYLPIKKMLVFSSSDVVQRLFDLETALSIQITMIWSIIYNISVIIFLFFYLCTINSFLSILYCIFFSVYFIIKFCLLSRNHYLLTQHMQACVKINSFLCDIFLQLHKIRTSGFEQRTIQIWWNKQIQHKKIGEKLVKIEFISSACDILLPCALFVMLCLLLHLQPHNFSIASILTFILCSMQFNFFVEQLSSTALTFAHQFPAYARIKSLLSLRSELQQHKKRIMTRCPLIEFFNVQLISEVNKHIILDKVSLRIQPSTFVGLVGPSGSGKSSLLRLLLGFEQATGGEIRINGDNINTLDLVDLCRQFGVVLQTTHLLPGSIYSNIAANTRLTLDEAWQLAEDVGLASDIKQMPMTMFTYVSDNASETLSGGQKQKILIARALATKPSILLLDEATSALDNESQAIIYQHLKKLNITRFVIAHRYSTIKDADIIYKLDQGKITFSGNYEALQNVISHS